MGKGVSRGLPRMRLFKGIVQNLSSRFVPQVQLEICVASSLLASGLEVWHLRLQATYDNKGVASCGGLLGTLNSLHLLSLFLPRAQSCAGFVRLLERRIACSSFLGFFFS